MPNWSYNTLAIKGSKENIVKFFNSGLKKNKKVSNFDELVTLLSQPIKDKSLFRMSSWKPIPHTFTQWDTANNKHDILCWLLNGKGMMGMNKKVVKYLKKELSIIVKTWGDLRKVVYEDKDTQNALIARFQTDYDKYSDGYDNAVVYQKTKYNVVGWYNFNREVWFGTKWDAGFYDWSVEDLDDNAIVYGHFDTAWCLPIYWLQTIQDKFGSIVSFYCFAQEEGDAYLGYFSLLDNDFVEDIGSCYEEYLKQVENEGNFTKNEDGYYPDEFHDEVRQRFGNAIDSIFDRFKDYVRYN